MIYTHLEVFLSKGAIRPFRSLSAHRQTDPQSYFESTSLKKVYFLALGIDY